MSLECGSIENEYLRGCIGSSGVRALYIGTYSGGTSGSTWATNSSGIISGGTQSPSFYTYELKEETGSFTQNILASAMGNVSFEQIVEMVFLTNRQEVSNRVQEITHATTIILVEDENSQYFLVGKERGCTPNGGAGTLGVASTDNNEFRVTLRTVGSEPAREVTSAFAASLIV